MTIGDFNLDEKLTDLRSDEGVDPVMLIGAMPALWTAALVVVFATAN